MIGILRTFEPEINIYHSIMRELQAIELKEFQTEYLNNMVDKCDLPDIGKDIRCLIDFSNEKEDREAGIFKEEYRHSRD